MHLNFIFGKSIEIFGGGNEVKYHWENDDLGNIQFVVLVRFVAPFCGKVRANFIIFKVISIKILPFSDSLFQFTYSIYLSNSHPTYVKCTYVQYASFWGHFRVSVSLRVNSFENAHSI